MLPPRLLAGQFHDHRIVMPQDQFIIVCLTGHLAVKHHRAIPNCRDGVCRCGVILAVRGSVSRSIKREWMCSVIFLRNSQHPVAGGRKLYVSGIVATAAGLVSIPTDVQAGRCYRRMLDDVMSQRRDLHVGGVIATAAGLISIPTNVQAGNCLGFMRDLIMTQCRLDLLFADRTNNSIQAGRLQIFRRNQALILCLQTEPGSIPTGGHTVILLINDLHRISGLHHQGIGLPIPFTGKHRDLLLIMIHK